MKSKLLLLSLAGGFLLSALLLGCTTGAADPPMVSKTGCQVDLKKVCQYLMDQPGLTLNEEQFSHQRLENLSVRHISVMVPWRVSGSMLRCIVDTQSGHVTDAGVDSGPALNDANFNWMQAKGLCQ